MTTPGAVPAAMGKRLLAHLIDQVAYLLVGGAFVVAGVVPLLSVGRGAPAGAGAPAATASLSPLTPLTLVGGLLLAAIGLFQWWYQGARGFTIGKRLVGLRTLSAQTGRPVGLGRILLRGLVVAAGTLVVGVGQLVVYLSPFFDATGRRQGWHDKAAGTMVFDVVVGRDPAEADQVRGAAEALQRLDALMAAPGQHAAGTYRTAPNGTAGAPVRRSEEPVMAPMSQPPVPSAPVLAPRLPSRSAVPVRAGMISAVPGMRVSDDGAGQPPSGRSTDVDIAPAMRHAAEPSASTAPQPVVPRPRDPAARPTGSPNPPDATVATSGLAEDVEKTRLRPARGKVPELPGDGHPEATIELTDGRRFTVAGTALIGRRPAPRSGEGDAQLIRVADPGRSVSKTHLAIGVDRAGVWIRDRDSTNGTVVTLTDGQQILCAAEQQVRVPPGASVAFGDYGLTVTEGRGSGD